MYRVKGAGSGKRLLNQILTRKTASSQQLMLNNNQRYLTFLHQSNNGILVASKTLSNNHNFMIHQNKSSSSSSSSAAPYPSESQFKVGNHILGYRIDAIETVPELCLTAYRLTFEKNGAEHLHIARDDPNNVFGVAFRTTPEDSTGVAHILEHLALCGSHRYPVRDPFMKMLTRSLSTFMNAFTGCDYTMYPFSTQNSKDFYNLMSIYLDAVFHPRLRYLDFLQEGWRLEHQDVNDKRSPLVFKGVVFNEMKGVFSSPSSIYTRQMINKLFPDNTYSNESGGDPLVIPELTYEQLKQFHQRHYHPSNAKFFTYGNFPLENHLEEIGKVIEKFEKDESLKKISDVPDQHSWSQYKRIKLRCQNDPLAPFPDRQTTIGVAWVLKSLKNTHENFALSILCTLLMDGPNSPFYQALIDSGLGSDYSPFSGYHNFTKQSIFSIGLQGISSDKCDAVLKAINMALRDSLEDGFPQERIEAILHRIELSTRHQSGNFGLSLLMYINSAWNHDVDPIECLKINEQVENFRNNLRQDPKYLQKLIKKYFLDNNHKLVIEMSPDQQYEEHQTIAEKEMLDKKISKLNQNDKEEIFKYGQELLHVQDTPEDVSVLPTLTIKDISRTISKTNLEMINMKQVPVQYSTQPTNGIVYFNSVLRLKPEIFPKKLIPYLPLFAQVLTKLGAGKYDRKKLDQEIQMNTGGLNTYVHISDHPSSFDRFESGIYLNSYCLERNTEKMFHLWTEIFDQIHFHKDLDHLIQLIRICSAELAQSVPQQGHQYAMRRAASFFGGSFKFRELTSGMTSLAYFRMMAASKDKIKEIIDYLEQISKFIMKTDCMRCAINSEASTMRSSLQVLEKFINNINNDDDNNDNNIHNNNNNNMEEFIIKSDSNSTDSTANNNNANNNNNSDNKNEPEIGIVMPTLQSSLQNEHFIFPFSTNYLGKSIYCAPFLHKDYAKLKIASSLISMKYLHKEIREKGGAYGGGCRFDLGGVFYCYSYRDPQILSTIKSFENIGDWILSSSSMNNYNDNDIDEAKLQVFQSIDQPIPPGEQGIEQFLTGITDDMKHNYRIRLLDVSRSDIQEVAERYLTTGIPFQSSCVVVLGPKSDLTSSDPGKWKIRIASDDQ